jgi:F0F1-type ATP synthase membrane subunit a
MVVLIQYARYGTDRFLGWDTPFYVYQTVVIDQLGLVPALQAWHYPHLYVVLLWVIGKAVGNVALTERILPFFWLFILLAASQKVVLGLTKSRFQANFAVILAGISFNTVRILADLNRQLMALALALVLLVLLANQTGSLFSPKKRNLLFHGLILAVAATQIETYFILSLAVLVSAVVTRKLRSVLEAFAFVSLPIVLLSPLLLSLFQAYSAALGFPQQELQLDPSAVILFAAGSLVTFPLAVAGAWRLLRGMAAGARLEALVGAWLISILASFAVLATGLVQLPAMRALYIMPVPILLVLGLPAAESFLAWLVRWRHA